jgi:hypothetical protein
MLGIRLLWAIRAATLIACARLRFGCVAASAELTHAVVGVTERDHTPGARVRFNGPKWRCRLTGRASGDRPRLLRDQRRASPA